MVATGLFAVILTILLVREFAQPGAWNWRNLLDVSIGLVGWFLVNTFFWNGILQNESGTIILNPTRLVPLLVNTLALIVLPRVRPWMATGILCAILVNAIGLLLFPAPTTDIVHTDPTIKRLIVMAPFYIPFFFPTL